jgi:hypothetical protein
MIFWFNKDAGKKPAFEEADATILRVISDPVFLPMVYT